MSDAPITVYWRAGCGFCRSLLGRSVAGGNETVPTVRVGRVALINPSAPDVLRTVEAELPAHLPGGYEPLRAGLVARTISRLLGG